MDVDPVGFLRTFNLVEAAIWGAFALVCFAALPRVDAGRRRIALAAGVAFALFGLSDLVERETGAWFRPWWLGVWKAACVGALGLAWRRFRALG